MTEFEGAGEKPKLHKVVALGNTYEIREDLKTLGFRWSPTSKRWYGLFPDDEVDAVFEEVGGLGARCEFED